jgi:hypothetical protein
MMPFILTIGEHRCVARWASVLVLLAPLTVACSSSTKKRARPSCSKGPKGGRLNAGIARGTAIAACVSPREARSGSTPSVTSFGP